MLLRADAPGCRLREVGDEHQAEAACAAEQARGCGGARVLGGGGVRGKLLSWSARRKQHAQRSRHEAAAAPVSRKAGVSMASY
ncbi:hypothetical protein E2562_037198 [Oryza meyeriana var. granulata]|uniref:Uncharacterized protein n=1 Tax=Oryza meyeriana var. granulata TaxID=110450 RepID=A0A6G1DBB4_9ORYZ|nr:hypothetical protein E2562_037198 [Oryza meyeriana var. granulata]